LIVWSLASDNEQVKRICATGTTKYPYIITTTSWKFASMKRTRPSELEYSKVEREELKPKLRSLVLPWALIALFAVVATAGNSFWRPDEASARNLSEAGLSGFDSITSFFLGRFLTNDPGSSSSSSSSHHQVYSEGHEPLFPLSSNDFVGFGLAIIGLIIAAGGGIGGGGILVPIYILVMRFSPKHAIPLSNVTVLGGALANTILNTRKRHPLADRPLVDWDLILVMEPLTIAGALIGAFLNKLLPEALLVVMLVVLLSFTAYKSLKQAIKMYQIENKHLREQGLKPDGTKESELTHMTAKGEDENAEEAQNELLKDMELHEGEAPGDGEMADVVLEDKLAQELDQILEEERNAPVSNVMILLTLFIVVLVINILKGGGAFPSPLGIKCGSNAFWIANAIMIGWIIFISYFVRAYLVRRFESKERCGYPYVDGDIKWDSRSTIVYPCICCMAGFFAGMFGVGKFT
jgi:uncharacterized membrane protein YfcA